MSEAETQGQSSFIIEPLLFFGQEVNFSRPPGFYRDLETVHERALAQWQAHEDQRHGDDAKLSKEHWLKIERHDVQHHWYEVQFRGRYDIDGLPETLEPVLAWLYDNGETDFTDQPDTVVSFLNETLALAHWHHGMHLASRWHGKLPEDSPYRKLAESYISFGGNVVLNEYCRLAIQLADSRLSDDWMVRTKHLITVCWTTANFLEQFIPEEVAAKKQLLREIFLEYASQDNTGEMRQWVDIFLWGTEEYEAASGDFRARKDLEENAFTDIVKMERLDSERREKLLAVFEQRLEELVQTKQFHGAVDLLDIAYRTFDLDISDIQNRVDAIVKQAVNELAADMRNFDKFDDDGSIFGFKPSREHLVDDLLSRPNVSEATADELHKLVSGRKIEYKLDQLRRTDPPNSNLVAELLREVSWRRPEDATALGSEQIEFLIHTWLSRAVNLGPGMLNEEFNTVVNLLLNQKMAETHLAELTDELMDNLVNKAQQPNTPLQFQHVIALISVLVGRSPDPPTPDKAATWRFMSKDGIKQFCESILTNNTARNCESPEFITSQLSRMFADVHAWVDEYWEEYQVYDW